jgi:site-specific recombinase XerC
MPIMQMMLGAGLRISEVAALKVLDIEMGERSGWVRVCMIKGMKSRSILAMS